MDPYADFCGPEFPLDVLPPTLAKFVEAHHRAMGADPSLRPQLMASLASLAVASAAYLLTAKRQHSGATATGYRTPLGKHAMEGRK